MQSTLVIKLDHITLYTSSRYLTCPKKISTELKNNGGRMGFLEVISLNLQREKKKCRKYKEILANNYKK